MVYSAAMPGRRPEKASARSPATSTRADAGPKSPIFSLPAFLLSAAPFGGTGTG